MIVVKAKTAAINLEMNPPEMRKARIERAKWSLMQKIMEDHPADRYEEVVFWEVPLSVEEIYELAHKYRREDGEWYFCGDRVSIEYVMNHVAESYVIVYAAAKVEESGDAKQKKCPCYDCQYRRFGAVAVDIHFWGEDCPIVCSKYEMRKEEEARKNDTDGSVEHHQCQPCPTV